MVKECFSWNNKYKINSFKNIRLNKLDARNGLEIPLGVRNTTRLERIHHVHVYLCIRSFITTCQSCVFVYLHLEHFSTDTHFVFFRI